MSLAGQGVEASLFYSQAYPEADINVPYKDQTEGVLGTWNHMGFNKKNFEEWKPKFDIELQNLIERSKAFTEKVKSLYEKNKDKDLQEGQSTKKDNTDIKISSPRDF